MSEVRHVLVFASLVAYRLHQDYGLNAKDVPCFSSEVLKAWCQCGENVESIATIAFTIANKHQKGLL